MRKGTLFAGVYDPLTGKERGEYVQDMFTRIAHRYDLMNRLMTAGQDVEWREAVIQQATLETERSPA